MKDLVITWPKTRALDSYLKELEKANERGEVINFKIPTIPKDTTCERCYIVYDGRIRGYNEIISVEEQENYAVKDPLTGKYWSAGIYIVRNPLWHPLKAGPEMKGFQGYRYIERPCDVCEGQAKYQEGTVGPQTVGQEARGKLHICPNCHGSGKLN